MARYPERCPPVQPPDGDVGAFRGMQRLRVLTCPVVNDPQSAAGSQYPYGFVQCLPLRNASCLMLEIVRLLMTASNESAGNGRSRASASIRSTRSSTPSATALRKAALRLLPL